MDNSRNRLQVIDGIRGFSLFGILLANLLIFQYGIWGKDEITYFNLSHLDMIAYYFVKIFVEGSFMPIFTFLFGYSMFMMQESLKRKQLKVKRHFLRRGLFLLLLGYLHGEFLWEGDILLLYGIMSFILLIWLNRKKKTLLITAGLLLLVLTAMFFVDGTVDELNEFGDLQMMEEYLEKTELVYGQGTYSEIIAHRLYESPIDFDNVQMILTTILGIIIGLPMFLFGIYAAKKRAFFSLQENRKSYLKLAFTLISIGVVSKALGYFFQSIVWTGFLGGLGALVLAFGYIFLIAYFYSRPAPPKLLKGFEIIGKLSLTNYLMQTVICTTIFYGYGLGWFGKLGVTLSIALGLLIYSLQMIFSYVYLKYFKMGPFEKINRVWTYFSFGRKKPRTQEIHLSSN